MYGILVFLILGITILGHELGHFLTAKALNMNPKEFGIGFGKTINQFTGKDGVVYKVNTIPMGGYVSFDMEKFNEEKPYKKFLVLASGVFFNLLLALLGCLIFVLITKMSMFRSPVVGETFNLFTIITYTFESLVDSIKIVAMGLVGFIASPQLDSFMGPIQLVKEGSILMQENLLLGIPLFIIVNINVMLFNMLPLPALDGGRLLFTGAEMITNQRAAYEEKVHRGGVFVLLILSMLVVGKDIFTVFFLK